MNGKSALEFRDFLPEERRMLEELRGVVGEVFRGVTGDGLHGDDRDLARLQELLDAGVVNPDDETLLIAIGVVFGDALERSAGGSLAWTVMYDEQGQTPVLRWGQTTLQVLPLTMILKRRQRSEEPIDLSGLRDGTLAGLAQLAASGQYQ